MISREVLNQALNPEALSEIVSKYSGNGLFKTIVNSNAFNDASYFMVRPATINGVEYILCPVLSLFDEEEGNEVGFAVDVDEDHFSVYAYEHNHNTGESNVLSSLPHCVHKAVTLDGSDYSQISDEVKMTANIDSAILFINHYLTDQALGLDSPFDVFDNKLYQQLINRLAVNGNNRKVVNLRLESLLRNYDSLDEGDVTYENNLLRANTHLVNFLLGCEDNITSKGFKELVDLRKVKPYMQELYKTLFQERQFDTFKVLSEWSKIQPRDELVQELYKTFFQKGMVESAKSLSEWSKIQPDFNEEVVQEGFKTLFQKGWMHVAKLLSEWSKIQPDLNEEIVQELYKTLFQKGWMCDAKLLSEWSGVQPNFNEEVVQEGFKTLFQKGWMHEAKHLSEWSGVQPDLNKEVVQELYKTLFQRERLDDARSLYEWSKIKPREELLSLFNLQVI
ncbi:MAG: hypothetical protein JW791_04340 [Nanoarchaeota archaeon]|nr:hypothetical protein [Nanoarchaeota archaeon]